MAKKVVSQGVDLSQKGGVLNVFGSSSIVISVASSKVLATKVMERLTELALQLDLSAYDDIPSRSCSSSDVVRLNHEEHFLFLSAARKGSLFSVIVVEKEPYGVVRLSIVYFK